MHHVSQCVILIGRVLPISLANTFEMPGRNDPCPCGSGKKYKHCCARHDAAASPLLRVLGKSTRSQLEAIGRVAIQESVPWEADVTPVPVFIESQPSGRHAAIMLVANDVILHSELEAHPPSDANGVAALLANAIDAVLARGGAAPSLVRVRHPAVAAELERMLSRRGVTNIVALPYLASLDPHAASLRQHISGVPVPPISNPQTWAAWSLPDETLSDLFASAAEFFAAAPWGTMADSDPLELTMPNGSRWFAVVLGFAGESFGFVLYEDIEDYMALATAPDPMTGFLSSQGVVISLNFDFRAELPKPMRREIADAKWPIAGPSAYPSLWTLNTIGGGLSDAHARELTTALGVVTRFAREVDRVSDLLPGPDRVTPWTDEQTNTVVEFAQVFDDSLWEVPPVPSSSFAEGARADAGAQYDPDGTSEDAALVARFAAAMRSSGAKAQRVATDQGNAELFVEVMHGHQGICLAAVSEFDLRLFLYDLLPRNALTSKAVANGVRLSLQRFFDYLAASEELRYPWASAVLRDKVAFDARWDSYPRASRGSGEFREWVTELSMDLAARQMLPSNALAGLGEWGETMGMDEATLHMTLQREWLIWREMEIASGVRTADELLTRLEDRQRAWETTPQEQLDGRSPSEVIAHERKSP